MFDTCSVRVDTFLDDLINCVWNLDAQHTLQTNKEQLCKWAGGDISTLVPTTFRILADGVCKLVGHCSS